MSTSDLIQTIHVEALEPRRHRLSWDHTFTSDPVAIFGGASPTEIDTSRPLAIGAVTTATVLTPTDFPRAYFQLRRADGAGLIVAQRQVPLEGSTNFRDLGGYAIADGRRVRWGRLFRSGHLSRLTATGLAQFAALNIGTVCDFRLAEERLAESAVLPNNPVLETIGIPPGIKDRFFFHRLFATTTDPAAVLDAVHQLLRSFGRDLAPHFARMFDVLLNAPEGPLLLNCSAGKERTGVGAALTLLALGVPRPTVSYDFMLSKQYFPIASEIDRALEKYTVRAKDRETAVKLIMPLLETRESYLDAALTAIDERYGSDAAFLSDACDLNATKLARLRDRYTD
ncbi:MAG: tyrosine-protein phosphatase [Gammaproteobacteria bacterium]|nr:tyrosine-protein phosphatase [Gammaproteobacteria bacterium]